MATFEERLKATKAKADAMEKESAARKKIADGRKELEALKKKKK